MIDGSALHGFVYSMCRECGVEARQSEEPVVQRLVYLAQRLGAIKKIWLDFDWIDDTWPSSKALTECRQVLLPKALPACSDELTGRIKTKLMPIFSFKPTFARLEDWIIALARISYCAERGIESFEAIESVISTLGRTGPGALTMAQHDALLHIARDVLANKKLLWHDLSILNPRTDRSNISTAISEKNNGA